MPLTKQKIIIAALLHDIGKFWQRGDELLNDSNNIDNSRQDWGWLVPYNQQSGRPGYQHAIWTWQFFERFKEKFSALGFQLGKENDSIQGISAKHHRPDSIEAAILQMADRWSSAIDRRKEEQTDEEAENLKSTLSDWPNWGKYNYKRIPLHAIFNDLKVLDANTKGNEEKFKVGKERYIYNLRPLTIKREDIFPVQLSEQELGKRQKSDLKNEYFNLWSAFEEEFERLPTGSFGGFFNSLLHLLKKYTWCIPSSTMDMPNVSLFEHLKTTAAFASCLHEYYQVNNEDFEEKGWQIKLKENIDPVLMCCLDLSGIQKFIYDIASRKAFQSLKGRSFYLQLLVDNLLSFILEHPKINQTTANIIYSSGGMAYFLLPNTEDVRSALESAYSEIQHYVFNEHKGKIFPALSWVGFHYKFDDKTGTVRSAEYPEIEDLGGLWRKVSELASIQKRQRFKRLLVGNFDDFFSENGTIAKESQKLETCSVTGEPLVGEKGNIGRSEQPDEKVPVLKSVERQTILGRRLKDCETLIHYTDGENERIDSEDFFFEKLNRYGYITDKAPSDSYFGKLRSKESTQFLKFNDTDFLPTGSTSVHAGYGFKFYGGNKQPTIDRWPKTFEEMCLTGNGENDSSKLGVLRMDVDNLGKIFIHGFDNQNKSFAAYATLSFLLDLFFSGYINTIWGNNPKYKENVSILYSGGDDLFAVGRWDAILEFAADVRKGFGEFTGRTDITLSAGIAIVDKKYPIYKAASLAGDAEDVAKGYENDKLGNKNSISFFGETISWNREFPFVEEAKNNLTKFVNGKLMNRSLLHQLQRYKALKDYGEKRAEDEGKPKDYSYKWHSIYYLKRFLERHDKKPKEVQELLQEMQIRLLHETEFKNADRYLDLIALAARWAEYELKIIQKEEIEAAEA